MSQVESQGRRGRQILEPPELLTCAGNDGWGLPGVLRGQGRGPPSTAKETQRFQLQSHPELGGWQPRKYRGNIWACRPNPELGHW